MVISLISHKGGTGKSTSVIHIAEIISARGSSVLLIDLDASCNLTNFYRASSKKTIVDFLGGNQKAVTVIRPGISIICGSKKISQFDELYFSAADIYTVIKDAIAGMPYEYIIIDTPHSIGKIIKNCIIASDVVIIPVMPAGWSADGSVDVLDEFDEIRRSSKKAEIKNCRPALLPSAISAWSRHDRTLIPALRAAHKDIDILQKIPFNRAIMKDQTDHVVRKTNIYKAFEGVVSWLLK